MNRRAFIAAPLALTACAFARDPPPSAAGAQAPSRTGPDGWAAIEGPDLVGAVEAGARLDIRSRADLDAAMRLGDQPKLLRVHGRIDLAGGRGASDFQDAQFRLDAYLTAYASGNWGRRAVAGPLEEARKRSAARQAAAITVRLPPRTRIEGATPDAGFVNGTIVAERIEGLTLRNVRFHGVRDHFPRWDPLDGAEGEWNSAYDALSLVGARRVWVDHCDFQSVYPPRERIFGRIFETNDGLLDITRAADLVTVSWCRFARHDKTMLIGGNDGHEGDEGHLRVTLHHNLWEDCAERTPRVRFGRVHVVNNLFVATDAARFGYSIGLGKRCRIVSEDNAWEVAPGIDGSRLLRALGGTQFSDRGSILNGRPAALGGTPPAFDPPPVAERLPAAEVAARVRGNAGPRW